ncbi:MAG: phenylalanine--tRNA ligase subunit beta [Candidatus Aminicenantes bacterium]|nr:phenylalanine--tRNA ligase subunit beta [Candidatus Aminicenantes bacterium]
MKISLNWLKDYVDIGLPLRELLDRLTMIGLVAEDREEKAGDVILDVETYANRPDTLGHLGMAREVGAMLHSPLKDQTWPLTDLPVRTSELVDVQILDEDLCPRYCGVVVKGVKTGPSPDWLRVRIEAMGLKPINNIVDVSNYVLFATAQPIHAFDLSRIAGPRILIRRAKKGETIRTLEGKTVALSPEMLVIADEKKPVAIAGVIGGEDSAVTAETQDVFIESATFDPASVRRTRKALEIQTDAAYRFERGADISFAPQAALMAASLLTRFGGKVAREPVDVYPRPRKPKEIVLRSRRIADLLGVEVGDAFVEKTLEDLGFALKANQQGLWRVQVPFFRVDIEREADLIEEIARFFGYDKIPAVVPPFDILEAVPSDKDRLRKLNEGLFHYGFDEVINQSFADPERESVLRGGKTPVEIRNPISTKASVLRTTLLGGLLENTAWNRNRGQDGVHIFEIGNVYSWNENAAAEEQGLGLSTAGPLGGPHWKGKPAETDLFHLKGALEAALENLRYAPLVFEEAACAFFEDDYSLAVSFKGQTIGRLGQVHGRLLDLYSVKGPVYAAELNLELLFGKQPRAFEYVPLPRFPGVVRDLSFLVGRDVPYQVIKLAIDKLGLPHLEDFEVIDHYAGANIPKDKKSLSLRFTFRNPKATLVAEDVDKAEQKIVKSLISACKIQLREGGGSS